MTEATIQTRPAIEPVGGAVPVPAPAVTAQNTAFAILGALSLCHLLNDTVQSLLPALYPVLQANYALTFTQIGLLHFAFQVTASLLQPAVGFITDKKPRFRLLSLGMFFSLVGLMILAAAHAYWVLIVAAMCIGLGSSIFHPDSSRLARVASGGRYGVAQSIFQVGGNAGTALGPLLAAFIVLPLGQPSVAWFGALALLGMIVLWRVGTWAKEQHLRRTAQKTAPAVSALPPRRIVFTIAVLGMLVLSKQVYVVSLSSYFTFYLIETFGLSIQQSQIMLFVFLAANAAGIIVGGWVGDQIGRKAVIWVSILGVLPFTLALPHVDLVWTIVLSIVIGLVISSAFSAIVVFAQELVPGRVGLISGIFFGFAFGLGGLGAAVLGVLADRYGIGFVYQVCAFLPLLGLLTILLPSEKDLKVAATA